MGCLGTSQYLDGEYSRDDTTITMCGNTDREFDGGVLSITHFVVSTRIIGMTKNTCTIYSAQEKTNNDHSFFPKFLVK